MNKQLFKKSVACLTALVMSVSSLMISPAILNADNTNINSLKLEQMTDGTAPFDGDNSPGNDSASDNQIVRSFDTVSYYLGAYFNYDAGITEVHLKAEIPAAVRNYAEWDVSSAAWANDALVDADGTLTATLPVSESGGAGANTMALTLKLNGAPNGMQIEPVFSAYGNSNSMDSVACEGSTSVTVSAKPSYNVSLVNNNAYRYNDTLNGVNGRIYSVAYVVQMVNGTVPEKGIKGAEYPQGDITFDIESKVTLNGSVQEGFTPKLYNYALNGAKKGLIGSAVQPVNIPNAWYIPVSSYTLAGTANVFGSDDVKVRERSVYDSGTVSVSDGGASGGISSAAVTITDYKTNGVFPLKNQAGTSGYEGNIGCLASGILYYFIPVGNHSETGDYYVNFEDKNLEIGGQPKAQALSNDDTQKYVHPEYDKGTISKYVTFTKPNSLLSNVTALSSTGDYKAGDSTAMQGQTIRVWSVSAQSNNESVSEIKRYNNILFFDGSKFEPVKPADSSVQANGNTTDISLPVQLIVDSLPQTKVKCYYVVKSDGGVLSLNEMNSYDESTPGLEFYATYDQWKSSGKTCIGLLTEASNTKNVKCAYDLIVKESTEIGTVYPFINSFRGWLDDAVPSLSDETPGAGGAISLTPDRYKDLKLLSYFNNKVVKNEYIPTVYDASGQIKTGTHSPSYVYGNSLLILGAKTSITKTVMQKTDGNPKTSYLISGNETRVDYCLKPSLYSTAPIAGEAPKTTITITDTLPDGMTYVPGSAYWGGTYDSATGNISGGIKINPIVSGRTLTWNLSNVQVGSEIEKIYFQAEINPMLPNASSLQNTAVISCPLDSSNLASRTASYGITIVNLSQYRLVKSVETPMVPFDSDIKYKLTFSNLTDFTQNDIRVMDILPYDGDSRGSDFDGTYTARISVQKGASSGCTMYGTNDPAVRTATVSPTENFSAWNILPENNVVSLTGIGAVMNVAAHEAVEITVTLIPRGNNANNVYKNNAYLIRNGEVMTANTVQAEVYQSALEGRIWLDSNKDGIQDAGESGLKNITVALLYANGVPVKNSAGTALKTTTDDNGNYRFERLYEGSYKVSAEPDKNIYSVTVKHASDSARDSDADAENGKAVINTISLADYTSTAELLTVLSHNDIGLILKNGDSPQNPKDPPNPPISGPENTSGSEGTATLPNLGEGVCENDSVSGNAMGMVLTVIAVTILAAVMMKHIGRKPEKS